MSTGHQNDKENQKIVFKGFKSIFTQIFNKEINAITFSDSLCPILGRLTTMTEFDKTGYVFMINNLSKGNRGSITKKYKALVSKPELNFKTWEELLHKNTDYKYYKSTHRYFGADKEIYHFIFRLNK